MHKKYGGKQTSGCDFGALDFGPFAPTPLKGGQNKKAKRGKEKGKVADTVDFYVVNTVLRLVARGVPSCFGAFWMVY